MVAVLVTWAEVGKAVREMNPSIATALVIKVNRFVISRASSIDPLQLNCFDGSTNGIDIIDQPRPEERPKGASRRTAAGEIVPCGILKRAAQKRGLLAMRSQSVILP
jgi:hypothetical protein